MNRHARRRWVVLVAAIAGLATIAAACGDDDGGPSAGEQGTDVADDAADGSGDGPAPGDAGTDGGSTAGDGGTGDVLPAVGTPERCALNEAAGTLTFMTGFDFAADAGILDIVVAEQEGYFDDMCLDVELQAGVAPNNSAALISGVTQLGAISTFGELVNQNVNGDGDLVAFAQLGHTSIAAVVVPADSGITTVAELEGATIGIKGDLPFDVQAMLAQEGLERGSDFDELLLDGFDPIAHLELGIDALPVFKSNEPAILENAGIDVRIFDPLDYGVPSGFAFYTTTRSFYEDHPTAVEDFVRAGLRGYHFAAENPQAAVDHAFELIDLAGNQFFLAKPHELQRWSTEQEIIETVTPDGLVVGQLNPPALQAEIENLTALGVYDELPDWESMIEPSVVPGLHDGDTLVWEPMRPAGS